MKIKIIVFYLTLLVMFPGLVLGQDSLKVHAKKHATDSILERGLFELSFGSSLLFISNSTLSNVRNNASIVLPTSAMLFFVEFFPLKRFRYPLFFNLPTETKQFLVNGQLVNERASPTFGTGIEYRFCQFKIDDKSKLEIEAGPLASFLMTNKNEVRFAPIAAARIRLIRSPNFVMYFGSSYSFGINSWGILFGTGTVF